MIGSSTTNRNKRVVRGRQSYSYYMIDSLPTNQNETGPEQEAELL